MDEKFVLVPIYRGFTEIEKIYEIAEMTHSFICGGYVRYMCSPVQSPIPAGDIDIFPTTESSYESNLIMFKELGYTVKHENDVAVTFDNPEGCFSPTLQIIKPVEEGRIKTIGTLEEILENFDFTVVRVGLVNPNSALADIDFLEDEKHKRLVFKNIHCPISSLLRANKYARKGYYLKPFEALKLFNDWEERDQGYRVRIKELFETSFNVDENGEPTISQKEIDELEALLRID